MHATDDPGWRQAIRGQAKHALGTLLVPGLFLARQRRRAEEGRIDGLVLLRSLFLAFAMAIALVGVVVVILATAGGLASTGVDGRTAGVAVAVFGVAARFGPRLATPLDCTDDETLQATYTKRFFLRVAFAEAPALAAFTGFILTANPAVYVVGAAFSAAALASAAPTAGRLAQEQEELHRAGCPRSLAAALRGRPASSGGGGI